VVVEPNETFMSGDSGIAWGTGRRLWRIGAALAGVIATVSMAACAPSGNVQPAPTAISTVTAAPIPTLAPLTAQPGYTITVQLGFVSPGVVTSGTSFVATKPFEVVVSCEGNGNLVITVSSPDPSTQTMMCTATPQTQTVSELFPKVGQKVHVSVAAPQEVVWTGIVAVKQ
jgi:hypothetical protein